MFCAFLLCKLNKMKKILLTSVLVVFLIIGCNQKTVSNENTVKNSVENIENARNSLNINGVYKGVLPCADCDGIETEISLNPDESYEIKTRYLGNSDEIFEDFGSYEWMEDGDRIFLENIDSKIDYYLVTENKLTKLDENGGVIKSRNDKSYELIKR